MGRDPMANLPDNQPDDLSPALLLFYLGLGGGTVATLLWGPGSGAGAIMLWVPFACLAFVMLVRACQWASDRWMRLSALARYHRAPY